MHAVLIARHTSRCVSGCAVRGGIEKQGVIDLGERCAHSGGCVPCIRYKTTWVSQLLKLAECGLCWSCSTRASALIELIDLVWWLFVDLWVVCIRCAL